MSIGEFQEANCQILICPIIRFILTHCCFVSDYSESGNKEIVFHVSEQVDSRSAAAAAAAATSERGLDYQVTRKHGKYSIDIPPSALLAAGTPQA